MNSSGLRAREKIQWARASVQKKSMDVEEAQTQAVSFQVASDLHLEFYGDSRWPDDIIEPGVYILNVDAHSTAPTLNRKE
jgi:hypothetical protein